MLSEFSESRIICPKGIRLLPDACDLPYDLIIGRDLMHELKMDILFSENEDKNIKIKLNLNNVPQGEHGFHIHQYGDLRQGCKSTCAHYNPHNKNHTPGGSSSGSAAAVAALMSPICFGTQTTGSVIRPAAYCGVVGYKPSYGDFDKSGILPNSPSIDTLGLISRSVEDISLFRSILLEEKLVEPQKIDLTKVRIGFVRTPHWDKTDPSTQNKLEALIDTLRLEKFNIIGRIRPKKENILN